MIRRICACLALLIAILVVPARPARAALEVTPFIGAMIPANTLLMDSSGGSYLRMQTHTVYGMSLGTSLTDRIGASVVLGTGTGKLELVGGSTVLPLASTLFFADLRGRMRILGGEQSGLSAVLGVGYTDFKTGLFDLAEETDLGSFIGRLTGIAGAELAGNMSERLRLNISVVDRIHKSGVGLDLGTESIEKTQNDIFATAGISFAL